MTLAIGSGRKLGPRDVAEVAEKFGLTEVHLRTVMDVETSGRGFDSNGRVERLFEPHIFYRQLKGQTAKLNRAIKQGLAYSGWRGPGSYPKTPELRWQQFLRAVDIDEEAAIKSASWGLGQIMGSEYEEAGYTSPRAMLDAFAESEREQLVGMCHLIVARKLDVVLMQFPAIQACRKFALRYNGSAYEKNKYHLKLQSAFNRWALRLKGNQPMSDTDGVLRVASKGMRVKALQKKLNELGYFCGAEDGIFGNRTRDMVLAWQADAGRPIDGTMDQEDLAALDVSAHRPIDPERSAKTEAELKKESTIISTGDNVNKVIGTTTAVAATSEVANQTGLLDKAESVSEHAERASTIMGRIKDMMDFLGIDSILGFINEHLGLIAMGTGIGVFFAVRHIKAKRLKMYQDGETL